MKFWRGNFGTWTAASTGLTTTNTFRGVTFGDVDLDGKPELIASRFGFPSATGGGLFIYKYDTRRQHVEPGAQSNSAHQAVTTNWSSTI